MIFVPTRSISVLLMLSLRKLVENQALTLDKQLEREDGGSLAVGFEDVTVKMDTIFPENISKGQ